jgi:hypothetical protein
MLVATPSQPASFLSSQREKPPQAVWREKSRTLVDAAILSY